MSELYDQRARYYNSVVSVVGKLTMSPSAHPRNLLQLNDLSDPYALSSFYMSKEEEDRLWAEREKAIAQHRSKHNGRRLYYPYLRINLMEPAYDLKRALRLEEVTTPEIYGVEVSVTKVLRDVQNKCVIVTGYLLDRSGEWHVPEAKYVGAMVPITMKPCGDNRK